MNELEEKEMEEQWEIAKKFADAILKELELKDAGAASSHIKSQNREREEIRNKLNDIGQSLFAYALEHEVLRRERATMISLSLFGLLSDAIQNLDALHKGMLMNDESVKSPFQEEELNEFWMKFRSGLGNNTEGAIQALVEILRFVSGDLLWAKFPEIPDFDPKSFFED